LEDALDHYIHDYRKVFWHFHYFNVLSKQRKWKYRRAALKTKATATKSSINSATFSSSGDDAAVDNDYDVTADTDARDTSDTTADATDTTDNDTKEELGVVENNDKNLMGIKAVGRLKKRTDIDNFINK
jgi:hypothetical protein